MAQSKCFNKKIVLDDSINVWKGFKHFLNFLKFSCGPPFGSASDACGPPLALSQNFKIIQNLF